MLAENRNILITDDDDDFRQTLSDLFRPRGFQTFLARDGEEALEVVRSQPIHLLLLDMHMPRLDGLETARRVRRLERPVPCILLSARMDESLARRARDAQVFSYLSKPIGAREMIDTVQEAFRVNYGVE